MTFPCLICGEVPVVNQQVPMPGGVSSTSPNVPLQGSNRQNIAASGKKSGGGVAGTGAGTTIRTLSKDVSDKIFQNLCRHLHINTEPYWFIQNPGEQMPLCALCSGNVLEIYTWQNKIDQFQTMIKKQVWKLERMVADTEIATNWMATREEQETEEAMWNSLPCPPMAIRIARERHHKFRQQILQNYKTKVQLRQKLRSPGQQDSFDTDSPPPSLTVADNTNLESNSNMTGSVSGPPSLQRPESISKRPRLDDFQNRNNFLKSPQTVSSNSRPAPAAIPLPFANLSSNQIKHSNSNNIQISQAQASSSSLLTEPPLVKIPSTISISTARTNQLQHQEFIDESEYSDSDNNSQHPIYPDVQIVCSAGPLDFIKDDQCSNSADGEESGVDQDTPLWNIIEGENLDGDEPMTIPEGEELLWLAPDVAFPKSFVDKLLLENLKPSVFLRKLTFAMFGLKQLANSSGIVGSSKPNSKPSVDRYKFEALREYTIETYGIRDNFNELEDLNRKIRTICCDARKALKRRTRPASTQSSLTPMHSTSLNPAVKIQPGFSSDSFSVEDENYAGIDAEDIQPVVTLDESSQ